MVLDQATQLVTGLTVLPRWAHKLCPDLESNFQGTVVLKMSTSDAVPLDIGPPKGLFECLSSLSGYEHAHSHIQRNIDREVERLKCEGLGVHPALLSPQIPHVAAAAVSSFSRRDL